MITSGPSGTGMGILTHNLLLSDQCYKGCFERIYYCSGSAHLDHNLRAITDYAEWELKQIQSEIRASLRAGTRSA